MTDEELVKAMGLAVAAVLPGLVEQAIVKAMGVGAEETPLEPAPPNEVEIAERAAVQAAEAEKARWDAMSPEELAVHEAAAARTRYTEAILDALGEGQDLAVLSDLERTLDAATVKACRAEARQRLANNPVAQATIDGGLKPRRTVITELLQAVTAGKATTAQQAHLADLLIRA